MRHGVFLTVGLIAAGFAFQVPLSSWQQFAPWLFVAGFVLLLLVLVPGVGRDVNGARRWLRQRGRRLWRTQHRRFCRPGAALHRPLGRRVAPVAAGARLMSDAMPLKHMQGQPLCASNCSHRTIC